MGFGVEKMGMHKPTIAWLQSVAGCFWRFSRVPTASMHLGSGHCCSLHEICVALFYIEIRKEEVAM
jgi:hypothetical protein